MGIRPECPEEVKQTQAAPFLQNDDYGCQEKHNGHRRVLVKEGEVVYSLNKEGEMNTVPAWLSRATRALPYHNLILDGELCASTFFAFDLLALDGVMFASETFKKRHKELTNKLGLKQASIVVSKLVVGEVNKAKFIQKAINENAEGIIFRRLDAPYRQGNSGVHKKLKFWKTLDAIVMGPDKVGKDSVAIGVYNKNGVIQRIAACSMHGKKQKAAKGNVIEVKYLYGTRSLHIVQPGFLYIRTDKRPEQCTVDQIEINKDMQ
jgi:bifunctional non-homologous end joining protein LigD